MIASVVRIEGVEHRVLTLVLTTALDDLGRDWTTWRDERQATGRIWMAVDMSSLTRNEAVRLAGICTALAAVRGAPSLGRLLESCEVEGREHVVDDGVVSAVDGRVDPEFGDGQPPGPDRGLGAVRVG